VSNQELITTIGLAQHAIDGADLMRSPKIRAELDGTASALFLQSPRPPADETASGLELGPTRLGAAVGEGQPGRRERNEFRP